MNTKFDDFRIYLRQNSQETPKFSKSAKIVDLKNEKFYSPVEFKIQTKLFSF